ncbi:hypothetical protein [Amycolatopsis pithecellobii]|uniref:Uncharacterized protein n=1 Tax=Amycolatopsis pithecellobii TaxID=664692 RepID=A0A6N7ZCY3_9PSEU|nr:hypothetical protein [Amycolatopsis pithecellobii]MTD59633.1 hypothetical protein [Amycolatopsis pithecellobii]
MVYLIIFLVVLIALGYAIERNHRRQRPPRMSGSVNYEDRDEERASTELHEIPLPRVPEQGWHEHRRIS